VTPFAGLLSNVRRLDQDVYVKFGNKGSLSATSIGDVMLGEDFKLKDVLYVPGALANLFSVKQATSNGATITFEKDKGIVRHSGRVLVEATSRGGLYCIAAHLKTEQALLVTKEEPLHRGHLGCNNLVKPPHKIGVSSSLKPKTEKYEFCLNTVCYESRPMQPGTLEEESTRPQEDLIVSVSDISDVGPAVEQPSPTAQSLEDDDLNDEFQDNDLPSLALSGPTATAIASGLYEVLEPEGAMAPDHRWYPRDRSEWLKAIIEEQGVDLKALHDAANSPDTDNWKQAMCDEAKSLHDSGT
jgi:hypothetical protein